MGRSSNDMSTVGLGRSSNDTSTTGMGRSSKDMSTVGMGRSSKDTSTVGMGRSSKDMSTVGMGRSSKDMSTVGMGRSSKDTSTVGMGRSSKDMSTAEPCQLIRAHRHPRDLRSHAGRTGGPAAAAGEHLGQPQPALQDALPFVSPFCLVLARSVTQVCTHCSSKSEHWFSQWRRARVLALQSQR